MDILRSNPGTADVLALRQLHETETPGEPTHEQVLDRVVVCADHRLWAVATASLLRAKDVSRSVMAVSSTTALLSAMRQRTDIAVVFDLTDEDAADLFEALAHRGESTPVLCVISTPDVGRVARLIELGATGAIERGCATETFCRAVLDAAVGRLVFPSQHRFDVLETIRQQRIQRHGARTQLAGLSPRERVVLRRLADGVTADEIALELTLSVHTVRAAIRALSEKLGVRGQLRIAAVGRDLFAAARAVSSDHSLVVGRRRTALR
jgi:DNA-binding NarL/FixJ family response regulator